MADQPLVASMAMSGGAGLASLALAYFYGGGRQPEVLGFVFLGALAAVVAMSRSPVAARAAFESTAGRVGALLAPATLGLVVLCLALVGVCTEVRSAWVPAVVKCAAWLGGAMLLAMTPTMMAAISGSTQATKSPQ